MKNNYICKVVIFFTNPEKLNRSNNEPKTQAKHIACLLHVYLRSVRNLLCKPQCQQNKSQSKFIPGTNENA